MKISVFCIVFTLAAAIELSSCTYRKGDFYYYAGTSDTVTYLIRKRGSGKSVMKMIEERRAFHKIRKDEYTLVFVSDSLEILDSKSILLSHSVLPDYEEDMLLHGFLGASFGTKEIVTYLVVAEPDFDRYFKKAPPR